jgi:hypothetical protein
VVIDGVGGCDGFVFYYYEHTRGIIMRSRRAVLLGLLIAVLVQTTRLRRSVMINLVDTFHKVTRIFNFVLTFGEGMMGPVSSSCCVCLGCPRLLYRNRRT